ncbi:AsnC family transcriptional regulator [Nocardioides panzhihuensis]|uniref:DNA-binding Lrp family transcriptional regulator n=1 Tax=Nocardioides panzhihuensis TaxID=860243 RepID=A0A7Z0DS64_9ACTN|nr:DNA-binding Lrp family transcriptional regulator [Nocardioides panzhihuensis]
MDKFDENAHLSEIDLQLLHALQIAPRAPWGVVAEAIGVSAVTAARRWQRLVDGGLAWINAYPGPALLDAHTVAYVDVDCEPSQRDSVVSALVREPQVASVEIMASERDLFLTVNTADIGSLSHLVQGLGRFDGVRGTRTRIATRTYGEGSRWRLDALDTRGQQLVQAVAPEIRREGKLGPEDRSTLLTLAHDGRYTAAELAVATGVSAPTARRRLDRLLRNGQVSLRCDVAHVISGWPVTATLWARVSATLVDRAGQMLTQMPEVRVCSAVTGAANLVATVWLRNVPSLQDFEHRLEARLPELAVIDRAITLQTVKRLGCLLDEAGRRSGVVPIDLWHSSD